MIYSQLRFPRSIIFTPSLADVSQFSGGSVQPCKSIFGPNYQLVLVFLCSIRNVGRHASSTGFRQISHSSRPAKQQARCRWSTQWAEILYVHTQWLRPYSQPTGTRAPWPDRVGIICGPRYQQSGARCLLYRGRDPRAAFPLCQYRARKVK